jgi:hypothetical protein
MAPQAREVGPEDLLSELRTDIGLGGIPVNGVTG